MIAAELLAVRDLRVATADGDRTLVAGVSFDVGLGETVGLVGESGSGKSLTARALVSLLAPGLVATGSIRFDGTELIGRSGPAARGRDIGLLMQDPFTMLNPMMTAGEHIAETLARHGGVPQDGAGRVEVGHRLAEVGIADASVAARYPFELSGGMSQRVGIAAALAGNPRLLVADEPTTALDATTQRDVLELLLAIQRHRQMSLLLITHDLRLAFAVCDRILVMYAGSIVEVAPSHALRDAAAHPYSRGLLTAVPSADHYQDQLRGIDGTVPPVWTVGDQCGFVTRCPHVAPVCRAARPPLREIGPGRASACARHGELAAQAAPAHQVEPVSVAAQRVAAPLLMVSGVRKEYRSGRRTAVALDGVDLQLRAGERLGVVGESGSGKTTLARAVLGLTTPTSGSITLDGIDISDYAALRRSDRRAAIRARQLVQCVFQDPYSSLNPAHSIGYALAESLRQRARPPADMTLAVAQALEQVGLPADMAARRPIGLSGGQRQRVAIARALAVGPRVLVCDEPVAALDVSVQAQVLQLLRDVNRDTGTALLFITHDLGVVRQVTDRVVVLLKGRIVETGETAAVLDEPQHDYTRRLVAAMPSGDVSWGRAAGV